MVSSLCVESLLAFLAFVAGTAILVPSAPLTCGFVSSYPEAPVRLAALTLRLLRDGVLTSCASASEGNSASLLRALRRPVGGIVDVLVLVCVVSA
jgi:hypothetical protein